MKKRILLSILILTIFILPQISIWENCWTNQHWNYYCSYDDGSYKYWNKQEKGNPYNWLPYYESKSSTNNKSRCPQNAYLSNDWNCYCKDGYETFIWYCVIDHQYHCDKKFPGTIRDQKSQMCICKFWDPMARSPKYNRCPITKTYCINNFWLNSKLINKYQCQCGDWYVLKDNKCNKSLDTIYNEIEKNNIFEETDNTKESNIDNIFKRIWNILIISFLIYIFRRIF